MKDNNNRELAAIMFTDIVGYTALMQRDEKIAATQRAKHRKVFQDQHEQFEGRILQYYGDGTLSVFSSAVHAAECALRIQQILQVEPAVPLRIGLHLGDIVFDGTEVYGDAVNVASRIESLAVSGSILLSGTLNNELSNKKSISTVEMGAFVFKNVKAPLELFAIDNPGIVVPESHDLSGKRSNNETSIAVLPFVNMSSDTENEYLSDGITEEIINALSKIENLKVTSRTSSFYFKNKPVQIKKIAKELGVTSILEGSVRVANDSLRITAQLIQAEDDYHFWSATWNRRLENIFEIQDEISLLIADKLREQFGHFEIQDHLVAKQTASLKAYELYLKGKYHLNKWNPTDTNKAVDLFNQAIELDSHHAESYAGLSDSYSFLGTTGFMPYDEAWQKSNEYLYKAQQLGKNLAEVSYQLSNQAFFTEADYEKSLAEMRRAVESRPSFAKGHQFLSFLYIIAGDKHNSRKHIDISLAIDPKSEETRFFNGYFYYMDGDIEKAIDIMDHCIRANDKNIPAHSIKATALICLNRLDDAIHYFDTISPEIVIPEEESGIKLLAYTMKGDEVNEALYLEKIKVLLNGSNKITAGSYFFFHHVLTGQFDAAFEWLEESIEQKSYVPPMRIADPLVRALRTDPRYERMRQRLFKDEKNGAESDKKTPLIKESIAKKLLQKLLKHLEENQPYLNPELTLRKLAEELNLEPNKLSWLINERLHKNFNDLINHYRIETFKTLATDPANANITILGLAYDSGFNSKTTFNTRFKEETGMTPKQFMKSQ